MTAGTVTVGAADKATATIAGEATLAVATGPLHHFGVALPPTVVAGTPQNATVTAQDAYGNTVETYLGPVHFEGTDGARFPLDHTFTAAERGSFTAPVLLLTAGPRSVRVSNGEVSGATHVDVLPGQVSRFDIETVPSTTIDQPTSVRIRAEDAQGNLVTWYTGTVKLTLSDGVGDIPTSVTFTAADAGEVTVQLTPRSAGDQTVTVTDAARVQVRGATTLAVRFDNPSRNYLNALYLRLLGRAVDPVGLAFWGNYLEGGGSRLAVATGVQISSEYRTLQVASLYNALLNRDPDQAGLDFFVSYLGKGGTLDGVTVQLMSSDEYHTYRGGATDVGFVVGVYADLLLREADEKTLETLTGRLEKGTARGQLVAEVINSTEARQSLVREAFVTFLGREPDAAAMSFFVAAQEKGLSSEGLVFSMVVSDEYYRRVS